MLLGLWSIFNTGISETPAENVYGQNLRFQVRSKDLTPKLIAETPWVLPKNIFQTSDPQFTIINILNLTYSFWNN